MSESDGSGELSLFRDAPPESRQVSIPSWRPSLADGWSSKAPSRRAIEVQGPDLLCRGLEFLEAVKGEVGASGPSGAGSAGGAGDALVQRFRERFVGPEDDGFRFDFDSELPDEEGTCSP